MLRMLQALVFLWAPLIISKTTALTINSGDSLTPSSNRYWESPDGKFGMGFFTLTTDTSLEVQSYYVGVVYLHDGKPSTPPVTAWVANRDRPASANSSLNLTDDSGLAIFGSGQLIWQTGTGAAGVTVAEGEMLDVGNFVLRTNSSALAWESFSSPTDTLLPGQKQVNRILFSWTSASDPKPGPFSLRLDRLPGNLTGRLVYGNTIEYWLADEREFTFTGENWNLDASYCSSRVIAYQYPNYSERITLGRDGNLRYYVKPPTAQQWLVVWRALYRPCFIYNTCGDTGLCNFDFEPQAPGNCSLVDEFQEPPPCSCPREYVLVDSSEKQLGCRASAGSDCPSKFLVEQRAAFEKLSPVKTPDFVNVGDGEACVERCRRSSTSANSSCNAAVYSASSSACWLVSSPLVNGSVSAGAGTVVYVRTPVCSGLSTGPKAGIGVGAGVGIILLLLFIALVYKVYRKKVILKTGVSDAGGIQKYSYNYLRYVTEGFSPRRVLGRGGFGTVFLGFLPGDHERVGVKLLNDDRDKEQGEKNFITEVKSLAGVDHPNVVKLLGFCSEGGKRLLVYEYVENGSLDRQLFQPTTMLTSWNTRMNILLGAAEGIEDIHSRNIVHRDIKPANILLDKNHNAKVADFGLAKLMEGTHATNFTLGGTIGYKAPECTVIGQAVTVQADVFSFGVMCVEVVFGRQLVFAPQEHGRTLLFRKALERMQAEDYQGLVDERLEVDGKLYVNLEEVVKVLRIAGWCLQAHAKHRPSMETVVTLLQGDGEVVDVPNWKGLPSYLFGLEDVEDEHISYESGIISLSDR